MLTAYVDSLAQVHGNTVQVAHPCNKKHTRISRNEYPEQQISMYYNEFPKQGLHHLKELPEVVQHETLYWLMH